MLMNLNDEKLRLPDDWSWVCLDCRQYEDRFDDI